MTTTLPFAGLAGDYATGRQGYPEAVIKAILADLPGRPLVLDLGCGTGIGSRQLAAGGATVIGADPDLQLIATALEHPGSAVGYCVATAEALPFAAASFAAVTAFGAFHWFATPAAIKEITRVLTPRGRFAAINKTDAPSGAIARSRQILEHYHHGSYQSKKQHYDPLGLLQQHGFTATAQDFTTEELYDQEQFLATVRSMAPWNHVPDAQKRQATGDLTELFDALQQQGKIQRGVSVTLVCGSRP